jgi:hypothetical protein
MRLLDVLVITAVEWGSVEEQLICIFGRGILMLSGDNTVLLTSMKLTKSLNPQSQIILRAK